MPASRTLANLQQRMEISMSTLTLSISGMSCGDCVTSVRKAIEVVPGAAGRGTA
jgi:hypothetical protein